MKFSRSLSDKHFVSKAGKHYFTQWDHDKKHRHAVLRKLERIQGLVALLDTWEKNRRTTTSIANIWASSGRNCAVRGPNIKQWQYDTVLEG